MDTLDLPLEMISVCGPDGTLRPARFRLQGEEQSPVTVRLRRIEGMREQSWVGSECVLYVCRGELGGRERRFELRYALRPHRWTLRRFLD